MKHANIRSRAAALGLALIALVSAASSFAFDRTLERQLRFGRVFATPAPVVLPKNAQGSILIARIEGRITPRMPPAIPLSAEQIATVRKWVDGGADKDTFVKTVQPILSSRCTLCHGAASAGNLRLDSFDALKPRIAAP